MKHLMLLLGLSTLSITAGYAQHEDPCGDCYALTGTISSNTTLNQSCYHLTGCVKVTSGHTLAISPGTRIFAGSGASLVIEKGAYLMAQGNASNPIVFTTDETSFPRTPGYWKGITIAGNAMDNQSGFTLQRVCDDILCGGMNDSDSSGVLEYVQIHYAGGQQSGDEEVNGLTLASVGSKTVINHVEVSYSAQEGFSFLGGTVNAKYLVAYNNYGNDVKTDRGYRGMMQYGLLVRLDSTAYRSVDPFSNGIYSINDDAHAQNGLKTTPVFSNFSIIGPAYCGATGLSSHLKNAVLFADNTEARIYNSLLTGWDVGFWIEDLSTIQNANNNSSLFFAYNSFFDNVTTDFNHSGSWTPPGCETSMTDWVNLFPGGNPFSCMQGNEVLSSGTGYSSSICGSFCENAPEFLMSSNEMETPDYQSPDLTNTFFDAATYRGGIQGTDWTSNWTEWCPKQKSYCDDDLQGKGSEGSSLLLQPNPAHHATYAVLEAAEGLTLRIQVLHQVTGKVQREISYRTTYAGKQRISVPVDGLREGVYLVKVIMPNSRELAAQLLVE